jgi:G:T-mismatch repair DNA endonuclease (very short patch repair protein)
MMIMVVKKLIIVVQVRPGSVLCLEPWRLLVVWECNVHKHTKNNQIILLFFWESHKMGFVADANCE